MLLACVTLGFLNSDGSQGCAHIRAGFVRQKKNKEEDDTFCLIKHGIYFPPFCPTTPTTEKFFCPAPGIQITRIPNPALDNFL
jgi:hypothetical protein